MLSLENEDKEYTRDPYSKALINIDSKAYDDFIKDRENTRRMAELEHKVNNMGSDLTLIKKLLINLADKK